jgi:hypothetical protein
MGVWMQTNTGYFGCHLSWIVFSSSISNNVIIKVQTHKDINRHDYKNLVKFIEIAYVDRTLNFVVFV